MLVHCCTQVGLVCERERGWERFGEGGRREGGEGERKERGGERGNEGEREGKEELDGRKSKINMTS